jgi:glycopeptide antibiotics resistance protein
MKNKRTIGIALWFSFFIYLGIVVYLVFFAESLGRGGSWAQTTDVSLNVNLVPFNEIKRFVSFLGDTTYGSMAILNLAGNIVLFMPMGFLMPCVFRKFGFLQTVVLSCILSFVIESVQLYTKLGSFDVDDIILNTIGAIIGFLLFVILRPLK